MYVKKDEKNGLIDFYSEGEWIEAMTYEETALFISEITKILSEIKGDLND